MTQEEEQRFLILLSSFKLTDVSTKQEGYFPTKKDVLDNISNNNWASFSTRQCKMKKNRDELVWRNEFAYTRKHLADSGSLVNNVRNNWEITHSGIKELKELCNKVFGLVNNMTNFSMISNNSIAYARSVYAHIRKLSI